MGDTTPLTHAPRQVRDAAEHRHDPWSDPTGHAADTAREGQTSEPGVRRYVPVRVEVYRGEIVESVHEVHGVVVVPRPSMPDEAPGLVVYGREDLVTTLRSSAKPFQVLPLLLDGVVEHFGLSDEDLAIAAASHSGEKRHVEQVEAFMSRVDVDASDLRCGRHRPFHKPTAETLGDAYTVLHHNCSGKHTAMLAWAKAHNMDLGAYLRPDHPVQERIHELIALVADLPREHVRYAVDGCGVPTFAMPLAAMARLFHHLADPASWRRSNQAKGAPAALQERMVAALTRIRDVFADHPYLIAGTGRPDTDLGDATDKRWFAKAGAEGLWCGADRRTGAAFAFKAADGDFRAAVPAALAVLDQMGLLSADELAGLKAHASPSVKSVAGRVVGRLVARVPST